MSRMIPLAIPNVGEAEARNLRACVDENMVSSIGRFVSQLEEEVAHEIGAASAVATSAGTTGLHAALHVVGVAPGDLVICPSFTFIATANAISQCGATPWLMDIDEHWLLDLDQLEGALSLQTERRDDRLVHRASGRRVAALAPVYCLGNVPDLERLWSIRQRFGLPVVADAAAALGASRDGVAFGPFADLSVISFNGNKVITAGGGGVVAGPDEHLVRRVRHITSTARVSADYTHDEAAFNYRMTNIQAAVGCAQMERLEAFVARKLEIHHRYAAAFADLPGQSAFPLTPGGSAWFSGVVLDPQIWPSLPDIISQLGEAGVEARPFWKPVHLQAPYADAPALPLTRTDATWGRILTLPCSTSLTADDQDTVISSVRDVARDFGLPV
jgi:perosamine synthetase